MRYIELSGLLLSGLLLLVGAQQVSGKAAYYGPEWMISQAEFIAVVNIVKVQSNSVKGRAWTYGETAETTVERLIKGELPRQITLHGKENFICAQVRYQPGRHLVFLKRDGLLLTGVNWHLGNRPITADQVEWFSDPGKTVHQLTLKPLAEVIEEIQAQVRREEKRHCSTGTDRTLAKISPIGSGMRDGPR